MNGVECRMSAGEWWISLRPTLPQTQNKLQPTNQRWLRGFLSKQNLLELACIWTCDPMQVGWAFYDCAAYSRHIWWYIRQLYVGRIISLNFELFLFGFVVNSILLYSQVWHRGDVFGASKTGWTSFLNCGSCMKQQSRVVGNITRDVTRPADVAWARGSDNDVTTAPRH